MEVREHFEMDQLRAKLKASMETIKQQEAIIANLKSQINTLKNKPIRKKRAKHTTSFNISN